MAHADKAGVRRCGALMVAATVAALLFCGGGAVALSEDLNAEGIVAVDATAEVSEATADVATGLSDADDATPEAPKAPEATMVGILYSDAQGEPQMAPACMPLDEALTQGELSGGWYALMQGEPQVDRPIEVTGDSSIVMGVTTIAMLGDGCFHVQPGATLRIYGDCGSGAYAVVEGRDCKTLINNEGAVELYGATLTGEVSNGVSNGEGARFVMCGGRVEGCKEDGILCPAGSTVELRGGSVTSNRRGIVALGTVCVSGTIDVSGNTEGNIVLKGQPLIVDDALKTGAHIKVACDDSVTFTKGYSEHNGCDMPSKFFSCDDGRSATLDDNGEATLYGSIPYVDEKGGTSYLDSEKFEDISATKNTELGNGWYIVTRNAEIKDRIQVRGNAQLLLFDDAKLTVKGGIHLCTGGSSIRIYGQKEGSGELVADRKNTKNQAGIGGSNREAGGSVVIYGGKVYAYGGEDAAGIGGGCDGKGGTVEVYRGYVEAQGKEFGAGIGGGRNGKGGTFTIHGGHVVAKGDGYDNGLYNGGGAGLGGGDSADGGDVYVHGGDLEVNGGYEAACIGGGEDGNGGTFTMTGGLVRTYPQYGGAGIGGGNCGKGGTVKITGGEARIKGGPCAAGIGGGRDAHGGSVYISDAKVRSESELLGAGIGGGSNSGGHGEVTIIRSNVTAIGENGAGIGGGYCDGGPCSKVTIEDSTVVAESCDGGAGIGGGAWGGNVWNDGGNGGTVIIRNSHVTADSKGSGAGIGGGGEDGNGGNVTIEGNSVVEAWSRSGSAIGRGYDGDSDGKVTLPVDARVISYDDKNSICKGQDRENRCKRHHHVKIEPCDHAEATYDMSRQQHLMHCPHCNGEVNGAQSHDFDADATCKVCGYKHTKPEFVRVTPAVRGVCGITFWYRFPDDKVVDYTKSTATLSVDGKRAREIKLSYRDADEDAQGLRGFTMPLASIELGQIVSIVINFGDNESVKKSASQVDAVIGIGEMMSGEDGQGKRARALMDLAKAQNNYGHYMQVFASEANEWKLGEDYQPCDVCYPDVLDVDGARSALRTYKAMKHNPKGDIVKAELRVTFGATAALDLCLTPAKGREFGKVQATCGKQVCKTELLADGRLHVHSDGLTPVNYADKFVVAAVPGESNMAFALETSLLGYAQSMMSSKTCTAACADAMASIYWYHTYYTACQQALMAG